MNTQVEPASSEALKLWVLLGGVTVNLYLLGAAALLLAVGYPLLGEVDPAALPDLHAALSRHLRWAYILPEFLAFLSVLPPLWVRPRGVTAAAVWSCVALGIGYFAVTFGWHLPAHRLLAAGDGAPAVMWLLLGSHAVRAALLALKCGLLLWMVAAVVRGSTAKASGELQ